MSQRPDTLGELLGGVEVIAVHGAPWQDCAIGDLSLDSRELTRGALYLALPGRTTHGLAHVEQALASGAVAVLSERGGFAQHPAALAAVRGAGGFALECDGLADSLNELASRAYGHPDAELRLVAVTGTDGKTSVCRFVADAFASLQEPAGYIGTLGWGLVGESADREPLHSTALTTPDAVSLRRMLRALRDAGAATVALEASSHGLAEGRLDGLAIDIAVLTNLGRDHLDYHGSEAAYAQAKSRLFDWPGLRGRVVNADDALGRTLGERADGALALFELDGGIEHVSRLPTDAVRHTARDIAALPSGLQFVLEERCGSEHSSSTVNSSLLGRFNVQNLAACAGVLRLSGVPLERIGVALSDLRAVDGRMQRIASSDDGAPTVIVDFAHTPEALASAIAAARAHCPGALWVIFGCGGDRDPGKRAPMARAAAQADRVVVTDDNPRTESSQQIIEMILAGFEQGRHGGEPVTVIADRARAIDDTLRAAAAADVVLIAGKGHEEYQIVGSERRPFSDREHAQAALQRRRCA